MVAALLQFPIYGLVLGAAVGSRSFKALAVALACTHVAVAALDISAPADSVFSMQPRQRSNHAMQPIAGCRPAAFHVTEKTPIS
jgi:hypothetical protein